MNRLDWNYERYRTRDRLYSDITLFSKLNEIEKINLLPQILEIAEDKGLKIELSQQVDLLNNRSLL